MLLIKQLYNKFFYKNSSVSDNNKSDSVVNLNIGLTPNYEIDLSLAMKDLVIYDDEDLLKKAKKIASFFYTVTTGGLNKTIVEFLMNEMPDEENKDLFDAILYNWLLLEQNNKNTQNHKSANIPLVEPSKVFVQYSTKNN